MKKAIKTRLVLFVFNLVILTICIYFTSCTSASRTNTSELRERISINKDWKFFKYRTSEEADNLIYDIRPEVFDRRDDKVADTKPTEAIEVEEKENILKAWILPTGNDFIKDSVKKYIRPEGNPGSNFPFVQSNFDDSFWETVKLPHDWAIKGPFYEGEPAEVGGGMGRLPSPGVAWYRKKLDIPENDKDKSIFLDIDGAMSYAMVWLNGHLVGGWPYGYASWRLDITPFINFGGINQLAIRLDNPNYSARWYPGGGIYRNVWLVKTNDVKVAQYGTFITTKNVTSSSATIDLEVTIDNKSDKDVIVDIQNIIYLLNADGKRLGEPINEINSDKIEIDTGQSTTSKGTVILSNPKLWGPPPTQTPNLYLAETTIFQDEKPVDRYETRFGIRNLEFNPDVGILVNGEKIKILRVAFFQ